MKFEVESGGVRYEVEAPDQETAIRALQKLKQDAPKPNPSPTSPESAGTVEDVARSLATGAGEGITGSVGLLGDVENIMGGVGDWVGKQIWGEEEYARKAAAAEDAGLGRGRGKMLPTTADIESVTGFDQIKHEPQTTAGEYARTGGQFATSAGVFGGPKAALTIGVPAGLGSEAAGQMTEGTPWETPARIAGGVVAGVAAPTLARRAITPRNIPAENARNAAVLRREGVKGLTEGQLTQSKGVLARERKAPGWSGDTRRLNQLEQFTEATLKPAGITARRATPDVIDDAFSRVGGQFDDLASRNTMHFDTEFSDDLLAVMDDYFSVVNPSATSPVVQKTVNDVIKVMQMSPANPTLSGAAYKATRSRLDRLARGSKDPELKAALRGLKDAFDGAMERSISTADAAAWKEARRQYRNLLVIEDAATTNTADAASGIITPAALRSATRRLHGRRNMARGDGDFEELSRAGTALMSELPLTGTAPLNARSVLDSGIWLPIELATRGARWVRMTAPVQRYLTNRMLPPVGAARRAVGVAPTLVPPISNAARERNNP